MELPLQSLRFAIVWTYRGFDTSVTPLATENKLLNRVGLVWQSSPGVYTISEDQFFVESRYTSLKNKNSPDYSQEGYFKQQLISITRKKESIYQAWPQSLWRWLLSTWHFASSAFSSSTMAKESGSGYSEKTYSNLWFCDANITTSLVHYEPVYDQNNAIIITGW